MCSQMRRVLATLDLDEICSEKLRLAKEDLPSFKSNVPLFALSPSRVTHFSRGVEYNTVCLQLECAVPLMDFLGHLIILAQNTQDNLCKGILAVQSGKTDKSTGWANVCIDHSKFLDRHSFLTVENVPHRALDFILHWQREQNANPVRMTLREVILETIGCSVCPHRVDDNTIVIGLDKPNKAFGTHFINGPFQSVWSQLISEHPSVQLALSDKPRVRNGDDILEFAARRQATAVQRTLRAASRQCEAWKSVPQIAQTQKKVPQRVPGYGAPPYGPSIPKRYAQAAGPRSASPVTPAQEPETPSVTTQPVLVGANESIQDATLRATLKKCKSHWKRRRGK